MAITINKEEREEEDRFYAQIESHLLKAGLKNQERIFFKSPDDPCALCINLSTPGLNNARQTVWAVQVSIVEKRKTKKKTSWEEFLSLLLWSDLPYENILDKAIALASQVSDFKKAYEEYSDD